MDTRNRYNHEETVHSEEDLRVRGHEGPQVIVLHGGPAARGTAAPLARALSDSFRTLEPWQRRSGAEPLTVARHVADLDELIAARCLPARPALVGESWGAMLALAYAAAHPGRVGPIVLVGCGTFDPDARRVREQRVAERMDEQLRFRLERLNLAVEDPDLRVRERLRLTRHVFAFDPLEQDPSEDLVAPFDQVGHDETWSDMLRQQERGIYPGIFDRIVTPVLMLHGNYDPHPGDLTRRTLLPYIPQLEYHEWDQCGHQPWLEKQTREEFFRVLATWLSRHLHD